MGISEGAGGRLWAHRQAAHAVRGAFFLCYFAPECSHVQQAQWLFVFDPKALHEIVIKHQDVYEETPIFRTYVTLDAAQDEVADSIAEVTV